MTVIFVSLAAMAEIVRYHPLVFANVTEVNEEQFSNAYFPMLVTLSGIVIEVNPLQPEKAYDPMLVTLPSEGMTLFLQPNTNSFFSVSMRQFPAL